MKVEFETLVYIDSINDWECFIFPSIELIKFSTESSKILEKHYYIKISWLFFALYIHFN